MTTKSNVSRRVIIFAVPPVDELDVVGPWKVFATANEVLQRRCAPYQVELVTTGPTRRFIGDSGLALFANKHCRAVKGEMDTLIIPGGCGPQTTRDPAILNWLRAASRKVRRLASVCTGAFLLAEAGLLDGKRATTHWMAAKDLARRYPRVTVEPDRIYVQNGCLYTSAGVTAGMDLALALVEEDLGSALALQVARVLVLFLRRPGGQSQFSALLSSQIFGGHPLRELQIWMAENVQQDLSVPNLASRVAMSPRNFARIFTKQAGITPARFVRQLRVEAARRGLEKTAKGLDEIAALSGFSSAEVMRRAFLQCVGTSPSSYRERFCAGAIREIGNS
jgi:transcriptional regulator GlxA family with amidase domain